MTGAFIGRAVDFCGAWGGGSEEPGAQFLGAFGADSFSSSAAPARAVATHEAADATAADDNDRAIKDA